MGKTPHKAPYGSVGIISMDIIVFKSFMQEAASPYYWLVTVSGSTRIQLQEGAPCGQDKKGAVRNGLFSCYE